ncbi:MAG: DNA recombination protein RmuC [Clostridiales bacterium]|nr:DNA recombination protein RmuC [Clostridiales bacterium]
METLQIITLVAVIIAIIVQIVILLKTRSNSNNQSYEDTEKIITQLTIQKELENSHFSAITESFSNGTQQLSNSISSNNEKILLGQMEQQQKLFDSINEQNQRINRSLTENIEKLQVSNEIKLEQMRVTVGEKLDDTLNKRLDSSFKTVSEKLEDLYKSLGEMQQLSSGVSDLQRLLTNVKARGTWAEVQLGEILDQFLTSEQFERNVSIKKNRELVEFAIKIPSKDDDTNFIWLPIDAKFPQEDYLRIQDAADKSDKVAVEESAKALERSIKKSAETISRLYIDVPKTTDFAILFLPTEGLYSEVLRRPGLAEEVQRKYHIMICGPTTITAFLNTLKVGFRTIAIDKKASEVWKMLGAAKQQYETFSTILTKAKKKIDEAGKVIDEAQKRNDQIDKKLRTVEEISTEESDKLLEIATNNTNSIL